MPHPEHPDAASVIAITTRQSEATIPGAIHCDLYDGGGKNAIPFDKFADTNHFALYLVPRPLPDTLAYPFSTSAFRIPTVLFFPNPAASEIAELGISRPLSS